ncbi:Os12g0529500 [Oryza sativa Japonica Group]|uniref:Os12g0529500 protein n=1 Tax=Oryza sativa subsp. japonica TaxID=39947 RepID=A0A0P0YAR9_ORYSJ|nr:Os12g0529500 [Oryza sativa Japonica Group]
MALRCEKEEAVAHPRAMAAGGRRSTGKGPTGEEEGKKVTRVLEWEGCVVLPVPTATADEAWVLLSDFLAFHRWHPRVAKCRLASPSAAAALAMFETRLLRGHAMRRRDTAGLGARDAARARRGAPLLPLRDEWQQYGLRRLLRHVPRHRRRPRRRRRRRAGVRAAVRVRGRPRAWHGQGVQHWGVTAIREGRSRCSSTRHCRRREAIEEEDGADMWSHTGV